jgi:hypothetical protein
MDPGQKMQVWTAHYNKFLDHMLNSQEDSAIAVVFAAAAADTAVRAINVRVLQFDEEEEKGHDGSE